MQGFLRFLFLAIPALSLSPAVASCGSSSNASGFADAGADGPSSTDDGGATDDSSAPDVQFQNDGPPACSGGCSPDLHQVLDCHGTVIATCSGTNGCDPTASVCANACSVAVKTKQSVGCEYYATFMEMPDSTFWVADQTCFAVFVANTWNVPAHLTVTYNGQTLPVDTFAYVPQ